MSLGALRMGLFLAIAVAAAAGVAARGAESPLRTVLVEPCDGPTMSGPYVYKGAATTKARLSAADARLLVSFDRELLAPRDWRCELTANSGGETLVAWNPSAGFFTTSAIPPQFEPQEAVMVYYATGGPHSAEQACPFFPAAAAGLPFGGLPCNSSTYPIPARESRRHLGPNEIMFSDPPGVNGTGEPSGGRSTAIGIELFEKKHFRSKLFTGTELIAATATCTVPAGLRSLCEPIFENVIATSGITAP